MIIQDILWLNGFYIKTVKYRESVLSMNLEDNASVEMNQPESNMKLNEPRHEKTCFSHMRITTVQISLCIRALWSAPLFFATEIVQYLHLLNPKIQDSR